MHNSQDIQPGKTECPSRAILSGPIFGSCKKVGAAFSLIEVMCAMTILVIALTGILAQMQVVQGARSMATEQSKVQDVLRQTLERIAATQLFELGTTAAEWSMARYEDNVNGDRPPLTDLPTATDGDSLIGQGFIDSPTGIPDFQVFIEYYRGVHVRDATLAVTSRGIMQDSDVFTASGNFHLEFKDATKRADWRLNPTNPVLQVGEDEPVVIRVLIRWNNQSIQAFTARRRSA